MPEHQDEPTPQERAHQALFDKSGASPEQIQVIQDWHRLLTKVTEEATTEQRILEPHQREARETRRQELTAKRFGGGLSQEEDAELRQLYQRMAAEQERP
jgi:hypothetical protein